MVLAGTLMVGGCGQKAADSTTATAQVTETSDSAPADKPDGAPGDNSDKPGNPPDGAPGSMDGKQAPPDGGNGGPEGPGGPGGQSAAPTSYKAVSSYSTDTEEDGNTYTSTGTDESAVLVTEGANITLKNFMIDRNSADSTGGDDSSFYGTGAAALAANGSLTPSPPMQKAAQVSSATATAMSPYPILRSPQNRIPPAVSMWQAAAHSLPRTSPLRQTVNPLRRSGATAAAVP